MGSGRDKRKKKKPSQPGQGQEKTERKTQKAEAKKGRREERKTLGGEDDIDAILAKIKLEEKAKTEVRIHADVEPPSPRVNGSFVAIPTSNKGSKAASEILLFGGEYYNGDKVRVYKDLYKYSTEKHAWTLIESGNSPPPRSAHQAVVLRGYMYVFGGEFTSPNQERFHHYKDLWRLDLETFEWDQLQIKGGPSPRSGHRMAVHGKRQWLLLFGGFFDSGKDVRYLNDTYAFDVEDKKWLSLGPAVSEGNSGSLPPRRSGCQVLAYEDSLLVYGGYSKSKDEDDPDMEKGKAFIDLWKLNLGTQKWAKCKRAGMVPGPRSGFSMAAIPQKNKWILFGGVSDNEIKYGEVIVSEFHNELYNLNLSSLRWFPVLLKYPKSGCVPRDVSSDTKQMGRSSGAFADLSEEQKSAMGKAATCIQSRYRGYAVRKAYKLYRIGGVVSELLYSPSSGERPPKNQPKPRGRINAHVAVSGNTMWMYGGLVEIGDQEITLDDIWRLDLNKLDGWACIAQPTATEALWHYTSDDESDSDAVDD